MSNLQALQAIFREIAPKTGRRELPPLENQRTEAVASPKPLGNLFLRTLFEHPLASIFRTCLSLPRGI